LALATDRLFRQWSICRRCSANKRNTPGCLFQIVQSSRHRGACGYGFHAIWVPSLPWCILSSILHLPCIRDPLNKKTHDYASKIPKSPFSKRK
jgi:hypothetical protein